MSYSNKKLARKAVGITQNLEKPISPNFAQNQLFVTRNSFRNCNLC